MSESRSCRPIAATDLWELERVGAPTPAGTHLIVPVTSYDVDENKGTTRLYRLPAAGGATPVALTAEDKSASQPAISPDGRTLAFVRKDGDDAKSQIYVMPLDGGEARALTDLPLGACDPRWMPDGRHIVCIGAVYKNAPSLEGTRKHATELDENKVKAHVTEDRVYRFWDTWLTDGKVWHIFVVDVDTGEARDVIPDSDRWFDFMDPTGEFDVSPDGEEIVFAANSSRPPHDEIKFAVYTVPASGGTVTNITPDHQADAFRPRYSPDGRYIVFGAQRLIDFYADRVRLVRHDRSNGGEEWLTEHWDRSASSWEFSDSGDIIFVAEDAGRVHLYSMPVAGGDPAVVCRGGTLTAPHMGAGGYVYFGLQSLVSPTEIARCPLAGGDAEPVTHFNDALMQSFDMGTVEELYVDGAEGKRVQTFVLYPPGFDASRKWPLLHLIHGGPHGVFGDQFHYRWNTAVFAAQGYVTALVNFHGSTSFGQEFAQCIQGGWGDKPLTDIMAATDALIAKGWIDADRIAVTGGSYGGYMTAWLTSQSDRFACAVCHAGVINLPGMYATDATQGMDKAYGGKVWENREAVERFSPSSFASGFSTPMLVIHGEKDYRVPVTQGLEIYGVLKAKGVDARLVYYPDENHWILKPQNSLHWYGEVLSWLDRFLGDGAGAQRREQLETAGATQARS